MGSRARLRIELPDRPGALASVARVIGDLGGNLCAVDIQEVDGTRAVDELLVDLPDGVTAADVGRRLDAAHAGTLRGSAPGSHEPDPVVRALRWACALASAGADGADDEAERAIATICGTSAVWLATVQQAKGVEAARLALARGKAVSLRTAGPPREVGPLRVAIVARPLADRFTSTEVERVGALLGLRRLVAGTSAVAVSA